MSKRTLLLLVAGFLVGGGIAAYLHYSTPRPIQRDDGSWELPHNPFAKSAAKDWQHVQVTFTIGDETDSIPARWFVDDVKGENVHRHLEVEGETFEHGVFSQKTVPTIEEFVGIPPEIISDVKFTKAKRDVSGRTFDCTKVSFMIKGEDGDRAIEELWLAKDVKGTGLVAWSIDVNDEFFIDFDLKGYGSKDKVEFGEEYALGHTSVTKSGPRYGEVMARFRALLAKKLWTGAKHPIREHGADEIVIDLKDGTSMQEMAAFAKRHGIELSLESHDPSIVSAALLVAHVAPEREAALLKELAADPLVEGAEHNGLFTIPDEDQFDETAASGARDAIPEEDAGKPRDGFPNDGLFDKQWHLRMIHAPEAWKVSTGKGVIVGVIDTGVAYEKKRGILIPDLAETKFVEGWDFVHDDKIAADDQGHGSHCAGTIAQSTNNGRGCAGVAPGATIMPIKVLNANGSGTTADVAAGIRFAADHGCKVLNLSLGGGGHSQVMANAVKYAHDKGCVVCCAAGNGGRRRVEYPAAYPGALAVSSVGPTGNLAFYSSYGPEVWVAGPGGDKSKSFEDGVLQNTIDPRGKKSFYGFWQGTSMATPHVAGVSALVVERGVTNPDKVMEILAKTATKGGQTGQGRDEKLGYGIVDAEGAVKAAGAPDRMSLALVAALVVVTFLVLRGSGQLAHALVVLGALGGAAGLGFLGFVPDLGFTHAFAEWGSGNPLFASAAIPFFLGLASVKNRGLRSLALGFMLGSAAHLVSMAWFDYVEIAWVPLERVWLAANGLFLLFGCGMVVRLGRSKGTL